MKKTFTLAAILFSIAAFAANRPVPSKISIKNRDNAYIQVKINGRMYNLDYDGFMIQNINAGYHNIEVYKASSRRHAKFGRARLVYSQSVCIEPARLLNITINRWGQVIVQKTAMNRYDRDDDYNGRGRNYDRNGSHHDDTDWKDRDWNTRNKDDRYK